MCINCQLSFASSVDGTVAPLELSMSIHPVSSLSDSASRGQSPSQLAPVSPSKGRLTVLVFAYIISISVAGQLLIIFVEPCLLFCLILLHHRQITLQRVSFYNPANQEDASDTK